MSRSVLLVRDVLGDLGEHLREHPAGHGFLVLVLEVESAEQAVETFLLVPPNSFVVGLPLPVGDVGSTEEDTARVARPRIAVLKLRRTRLRELALV